jgi:hypothetical protein
MELVHCIYVKEYWDHIRYALECVIEKTNADWIPEDVYAACMMGQARVYLAPDGVIVFKLLTDNITNQNSLFVWAAYSKDGNALIKYHQDVDAIAKEFGASKISFASPRKAWHKAIHKIPGWYEVETVYEKRI